MSDAAKRKRGRPPIGEQAGKRYQIRLMPRDADLVRRLGEGSLSRGIATLAAALRVRAA
jgi:hypothetical protein